MSKFKFKLNSDGVRRLLKSDEMMKLIKEKADATANACGEGYVSSTYTGKTRVNASIYAETFEAKRDNLKNNTILKALR